MNMAERLLGWWLRLVAVSCGLVLVGAVAVGCQRLAGLRTIVPVIINAVTNEPARPAPEVQPPVTNAPDSVEPSAPQSGGGDCWVREIGGYRTAVCSTKSGVIYAACDEMGSQRIRLLRVTGSKVADLELNSDPANIGPAEILTPRLCAVGEDAYLCCQYFTSRVMDKCGQGLWRIPAGKAPVWLGRFQAGATGWNRCDLLPWQGGVALCGNDGVFSVINAAGAVTSTGQVRLGASGEQHGFAVSCGGKTLVGCQPGSPNNPASAGGLDWGPVVWATAPPYSLGPDEVHAGCAASDGIVFTACGWAEGMLVNVIVDGKPQRGPRQLWNLGGHMHTPRQPVAMVGDIDSSAWAVYPDGSGQIVARRLVWRDGTLKRTVLPTGWRGAGVSACLRADGGLAVSWGADGKWWVGVVATEGARL